MAVPSPIFARLFAVLVAGLTASACHEGKPPQVSNQSTLPSGVASAYPVNPPAPANATAPDATTALHVPSSSASFTVAQLMDQYNAPDWHPADHPPMPEVVAHGRKPAVKACAFCHLPTGDGRPENASLAGLPSDYIIAQVAAFRNGSRTSSAKGHAPTELMIGVVRAARDAEIASAAVYFSALRHRSFVRVVEGDTIPAMHVAGWVYARKRGGGTEPLGSRIVESPDDFDQFEHRDPATRFTAFVATGSIAHGRALAEGLGNTSIPACASCHGADFRGTAAAPMLAGRSPTMLVRQLNDFRTGARGGPAAAPMSAIAHKMRDDEMIALAAYMAKQKP